MRKKDKNSYFYSILKVVNKKVPGLIHQCPYQVRLLAVNISRVLTFIYFQGQDLQVRDLVLGQSDIALWITGQYKVVYTFFDDMDNRLLRVSGQGTLKRN
jgi:hypothetical protein